MSKHTPGPWKFEIAWAGFSAIRGRDGQLIFGVAAGSDDERRLEPEIEANAHLIAAAPDLLEALEDLRPILDAFERGQTRYADLMGEADLVPEITKARAAIAKAKGKDQ